MQKYKIYSKIILLNSLIFTPMWLERNKTSEWVDTIGLTPEQKKDSAKATLNEAFKGWNFSWKDLKNMSQDDVVKVITAMETLFDSGRWSIHDIQYWLHWENTISANMKYGTDWYVLNTKDLWVRKEEKRAQNFIY